MMIFVWIGLAFFAGIALYIVMPWTAAKIAGDDWVEKVSGTYTWLAQTAATKSAIVERDGSLELVSKRFDSEILGDKDKEHGDPRHHQDGFSVLSRLKNKSFGVALGDRAEYVSPLLAEIGERAWRAKESDEIGKADNGGDDAMRDGILIDKGSKLVDIARARHLTTGDADPEDGHESYLWTEISQEKFNERLSFGQSMIIVLGALGSMVAMFYLTSQTGGSGGGGGASAPVNNTTTVSMLFLFAAFRRFSLDDIKNIGRKGSAGLWVVGWVVTWPLTALLFEGLVMALIVAIVMTGVAMVIPVGIALAGPSIPKSIGLILARGHWILSQLTVGRGVLVRRETGEYEHHKLLEADPIVENTMSTTYEPEDGSADLGWVSIDDDDRTVTVDLAKSDDIKVITNADLSVVANFENESKTIIDEEFSHVVSIKETGEIPEDNDIVPADEMGLAGGDGLGELLDVEIVLEVTAKRDLDYEFVTTLSDGKELPIYGSEGDLYRFGWAPLGITEEKGRANMDPITQSPPANVQADGGRIAPDNTRQGYRPLLQIPGPDQWLVTLPQLWSWCQGTSESETVEQGRDKALTENGGAQQVGIGIFSVVVLASVVIGGAFGWLAAGGLG